MAVNGANGQPPQSGWRWAWNHPREALGWAWNNPRTTASASTGVALNALGGLYNSISNAMINEVPDAEAQPPAPIAPPAQPQGAPPLPAPIVPPQQLPAVLLPDPNAQPPQPPAANPQPPQESRLRQALNTARNGTSAVVGGTLRAAGSPFRWAGSQLVQGPFDRMPQELQNLQPQIRQIFNNVLFRSSPRHYRDLQQRIQQFLQSQNPLEADLDRIKQLLNGLNAAEIRQYLPNLRQDELNRTTGLRDLLNRTVVMQNHALVVPQAARDELRTVEDVFVRIIRQDGVLAQLTDNLAAPDGPTAILRQQFIGRVPPSLREAKTSIERYRGALANHTPADQLIPLIRDLQAKLTRLTPIDVPQNLAELNQFAQDIPNRLEGIQRIIDTAFNAQLGIAEGLRDILQEGINQALLQVANLPGPMLNNIRQQINGRVPPSLREAKTAIDTYRTALRNNIPAAQLIPLIRDLQAKLTRLTPIDVPQNLAELNQFAQDIPNRLEEIQRIIDAAFNAQLGLAEGLRDILQEGINQALLQVSNLPGPMLNNIRQQLNGRVPPSLREAKTAIDTYRTALRNNTPAAQLLPLIQDLQAKLTRLTPIDVPQNLAELNQFAQDIPNRIEEIQRIIDAAFNPRRGIVEEGLDNLNGGVAQALGQVENLPGRMVNNIIAPNGPLDVLRQQLNGRVSPSLREAKTAIDTYRTSLRNNIPAAQLLPLIQDLQAKLTRLTPMDVPQNLAELNQFAQDIPNRIEEIQRIIDAAYNPRRGILEEGLDNLNGGVAQAIGQVENLPGRMVNNIVAPNGPLDVLRQQINGRVPPSLREVKTAIDTYRTSLRNNIPAAQLLPLIQDLHAKLTRLVQIDVPQGWAELNQFTQDIQNVDAANLPAPNRLERMQQIIDAAFNARRGIIEEGLDNLNAGVAQALGQAANLPRQMYNNFMAPAAPQAAAQPPAPGQAQPDQNVLDVGGIAAQARQMFNNLLAYAGNALAGQGARGLATLCQYLFTTVRDNYQRIPENQRIPQYQDLLNRINPMIDQLGVAAQNQSAGQVIEVLRRAFAFITEQQIYFQGLRLPLNPVRHLESAIPHFFSNINAHQNALQPERQIPQQVTDEMISHQAELVKLRTASYGPARMILEKICGIPYDEAIYAEIYKSGASDADLNPLFRSRIFDRIDRSDANVIRKWTAKFLYDWVLFPISRFYVNSVIDGFIGLAQGFSRDNRTKEETVINSLRNWLAVTSGAYNQVAHTPPGQSRDFMRMMEEALQAPERNGGLDPKEFFGAVAKTIMDAFGPQIKWSETIDDHFKTEIPADSPLNVLNPLVRAFNAALSLMFKVFVFVPQWVGNKVLQNGAKIAFSNTPLLQDLSERSIESLRRNTPASYAMHRILYRQLQKLRDILQRGLNDEAPNPALADRDTNIRKVELAGLVESLLEVLSKSQCRTQDRLRDYLTHQSSLRDRALREADDIILPEIMETAVTSLSIALRELTGENELKQLIYDGLFTANDFFGVNQPVPDEEFAAVERGTKELMEQVLEQVVFHAVRDKFDFTNVRQRRGIDQFMLAFKAQSRQFATAIHPIAQSLTNNPAMTPEQLSNKLSEMIRQSTEFNRERVAALGAADGNPNFHTETKLKLNELSRQLLDQYCNPIAQRLNQMKGMADAMKGHYQSIRTLHQYQNDLNGSNLPALQTHLENLRRNGYAETANLTARHQEYTGAKTNFDQLQQSQVLLERLSPLISGLEQEKLAHPTQSSSRLKTLERELSEITNALPNLEQKRRLNELILSIIRAARVEDIRSLSTNLTSAVAQIRAGNTLEIQRQGPALIEIKARLQQYVQQAIQECTRQYGINKAEISARAAQIAQSAPALNTWADQQQNLPIWDLFAFDMNWVTETVKTLAINRAKSKFQQLFDAIYQRHNYIGFVNQTLLLPFLEKYGKDYLKP